MPAPDIFGHATGAVNGYTTVRWVSSAADGAGDGTTSTVGGATGAWTISQAEAAVPTGHLLILIMDDGTYDQYLSNTAAPTGGYKVLAGTDNQNGANSNGGRPVINLGGAGLVTRLQTTNQWLENLEIRGSTSTSGCQTNSNCVLWNCIITDNTRGIGVEGSGSTNIRVAFCDIHTNDDDGILGGTANTGSVVMRVYCSKIHDNGGQGLEWDEESVVMWCEIYDNTLNGINNTTNNSFCYCLFNLIEDNTQDGINHGGATSGQPFIMASLITNNADGIDYNGVGQRSVVLWSVFFGNSTAETETSINTGGSTNDPEYVSVVDGSEDFTVEGDVTFDFPTIATTGDMEALIPGPSIWASGTIDGVGGGTAGAVTRFNRGFN